MLTYENLYNAPLDPLRTAVEDWAAMVRKLKETRDDVDGVTKPLDDSGWEGKDADAGRAFVKKVGKEFDDAIKEADGIQKILDEAYQRLDKAKKELHRLVDQEAPRLLLEVETSGRVKIADAVPPGPPKQDEMARRFQQMKSLSLQIESVLADAEQAEQTAAWALYANTTGDRGNFNGKPYDSLEEAWRKRIDSFDAPDDNRRRQSIAGWEVSAGQRELYDSLSVADKAKLLAAGRAAGDHASVRFPGQEDTHGTQWDAYRHTYFNARLARDISPEFAKRFMDANEGDPDPNRTREIREKSDLHNNQLGREIGTSDLRQHSLEDAVEEAVRSGRTTGIHGRQIWASDQV